MARLYSNENFPLPAVEALRAKGHDVLTTRDAGKANEGIPDDEVLEFASREGRAVLTHNRKDFIRLTALSQTTQGSSSAPTILTLLT
jgi:predicted nuclease of predicted toxin-antitoxin system